MASGRLIDYLGEGVFSARPVAPDLAVGALGMYYATDTSTLYAWDGSAWDSISGGGGSGAPITATTTAAGTTLTATGANAWNYTRFTNAGTKTYTLDSAQTYTTNAEYHGRNVGAGDLTITAAGAFVITPPVGGSLVIPSGQSFFLKITGTNTADLILQSPSGTGPPPPGSPPVFLDKTDTINSSTMTHNVVFPATVGAGDLIIAMGVSSSIITTSLAVGWTVISVVNGYVLAYMIATGTEGGTTVPLYTVTANISSTNSVVRIQAGTFYTTTPFSASAVSASTPFNIAVPVPPAGGWRSTSVLWMGFLLCTSAISTAAFAFPDNRQSASSSRIIGFSTIVRPSDFMWDCGVSPTTSVSVRQIMIGVNPL